MTSRKRLASRASSSMANTLFARCARRIVISPCPAPISTQTPSSIRTARAIRSCQLASVRKCCPSFSGDMAGKCTKRRAHAQPWESVPSEFLASDADSNCVCTKCGTLDGDWWRRHPAGGFALETRRKSRHRDAGATKTCALQQITWRQMQSIFCYEPAAWLIAAMRFFISSGDTSSI